MRLTSDAGAVLVAPGFAPRVPAFDLEALDAAPELVVGVFADDRVGFVNAAYVAAGQAAGGPGFMERWGLGASVALAIDPIVREGWLEGVASVRDAGRVWRCTYECPTPTHRRRFGLIAYPGLEGAVLFVHACLVEEPAPALSGALESDYRGPDGLVVQCAECRRVRRPGASGSWDFVSLFVERPVPRVTHGLCEPCAAHVWGG